MMSKKSQGLKKTIRGKDIKKISLRYRVVFLVITVIVFGVFSYMLAEKTDMISFFSQKNVSSKPLCKDCNVLLVTIDICGAVHMPCYGYDKQTTPNLCKFGKDNIFFRNAYANSPSSSPSHASIFTGLFPSNHGIVKEGSGNLSENTPLLSEVFHQHGYETVIYMGPNMQKLSVDSYKRGMTEMDGEGLDEDGYIQKAMNKLVQNDKAGKKTFVSFYNSQCHEPYFTNGEKLLFTKDNIPDLVVRDQGAVYRPLTREFYEYLLEILPKDIKNNQPGDQKAILQGLYDKLKSAPSFAAASRIADTYMKTNDVLWTYTYAFYIDRLIDPKNTRVMNFERALYDQKLFDVDTKVVSHIAETIKNSSLKKDTVVLITSEHGQEFGEHGITGHSTLYDLNTKVPFVMYVPGVRPRSISQNVQGVDIMPTLLDLVGIPNTFSFDGMSLLPLITGGRMPGRLLVADGESGMKKTLRLDTWKLFVTVEGDSITPYELYDTKSDPAEKRNVLPSHFDVAKKLIALYKETILKKAQ